MEAIKLCRLDTPISFIEAFFFQAEYGIRDADVTGVQTCALPICLILIPSPKPPDAIIGIFTLSAATGMRIRPGVSSSPGWPAHSKPSIEIASTPMRSAESARSEERRVGKECRCRWRGDR